MDINDIYFFLRTLIRKNRAGGLTSTQFAALWNGRQSSYFADLMGRFQNNNTSKEGMNTGLIENQTIFTKLTPFTKNDQIIITGGVGPKPDGFIYKLGLRINGAKVIIVSHDKYWSIAEDVIDPPSVATNTYYATEIESDYWFIPNTVTTADLDYIVAPTDVFWNFNIDPVTKQQVYTAVGSSQSQWDDISNREITEGVLKSLGVSYHDKDFESFGQSVIKSGS